MNGEKKCLHIDFVYKYKIFLVGSDHTLRQKKRQILYFLINFNEIYLFIVSCWSGLRNKILLHPDDFVHLKTGVMTTNNNNNMIFI